VKKIPLTQGFVAIVDDEDFERLKAFKWHAVRTRQTLVVYAGRTVLTARGKRRVLMHREILGASRGELVDHRDRDGLNNGRKNLRHCDRFQNAYNRVKVRLTKTSRFQGVSWYAPTKRWKAQIQAAGKKRGLGYFRSEEAAARAYDTAARELHGAFAVPNFPVETRAASA